MTSPSALRNLVILSLLPLTCLIGACQAPGRGPTAGQRAPAPTGELLAGDNRVQTGKLGNGMRWLYRKHDNPPGKMALLIHVETGSLNETDAQRGLAHFIEHMSFNGTEHFPPGKLIPYFESIGMEFGHDLNAFTSFDQTVYMLYLPDTTTEQVDKALMVLSDYAYRLTLLPEEIDKERGVILAELRAGMSAQQRLREKLLEQLFAGTRVGQRLPIGKEEVIKNAPRAALESYYRTWYRPERITLIMVGDAEPAPYLPLIEKWFGQYRPAAKPEPGKGPEFKPFTQERAIVLSDAEYPTGDVDLYDIRAARPPTTTVEQYRVDLIERIASWIMDRRFAERIKKGAASYREAGAGVERFLHDGLLVSATAKGEPQDWEKMLDELVAEVNRAREHGFTAREFELAQKELLAEAEHAVGTEPTRDARRLAREITQAVNEREPILSAAQELELLKRLLPPIKLDEVSAAFAAHYAPGTFAYVLTLPAKENVKLPSADEVLAAARAAQARKVEAPREEAAVTSLLEKEPVPGKAGEFTTEADLGVTSAWLANGARVHHRFMDYKKDTVLVSITLAGGQMEETAGNAGITAVAGLALAQPATRRLSSTAIQDLMTGKSISLQGGGQDDAFMVTIKGSPKDLETGLQLAHALLTDGRIEESALNHWKQAALQQYQMQSKQPRFVARDALLDVVGGGDPRKIGLMKPAQIEAQSLDKAQAWLERLCREAPLEVAVVGELPLDQALPLIEKYVGSLPARPRLAGQLDALRKFKRGPGPYERRVGVDTITPQAVVICGFLGCDGRDIADVRALNLAANILDSRLVKRVREELSLVYSISAQNGPSWTYDDAGIFASGAPCAPDKVAEVAQEIEMLCAAFAESGPAAEELDNAKKQIANQLDVDMQEPEYWFARLMQLDLHRLRLDDLKNVPGAYAAYTAEQVRDAFRKYRVPARLFQVAASPAVPASPPAPK